MGFELISVHRKIQNGNSKEFEKLFRSLYTPLCNFAFSFLRDMDAAEEIVQELFYNYWKNRQSINIKSSIKSYLYQATRNSCIKSIDHKKVKEKYASNYKNTFDITEKSPQQEMEAMEVDNIIESSLKQLPEKCREIFMLNRFDGLKYKEIADKLSISIKTVEANMGKALKILRENLALYNKTA
jgi:RNA polymerase sigma-70 factor, ECF subfamily